MHSYHYYLIAFAVIMLIGLGFYIYVGRGYFPVALVNSEVISEWQYQKNLTAILNYADAVEKTYQNIDFPKNFKDKKEIQKLALQGMVENKLIHQELVKRLGADLNSVVDNKLSEAEKKNDFQKAASTLYGITFNDYLELFLKPVAEHEILDGKLFAENTKLDDWLIKAKNSAQVIVLAPNLIWKDGRVETR